MEDEKRVGFRSTSSGFESCPDLFVTSSKTYRKIRRLLSASVFLLDNNIYFKHVMSGANGILKKGGAL